MNKVENIVDVSLEKDFFRFEEQSEITPKKHIFKMLIFIRIESEKSRLKNIFDFVGKNYANIG